MKYSSFKSDSCFRGNHKTPRCWAEGRPPLHHWSIAGCSQARARQPDTSLYSLPQYIIHYRPINYVQYITTTYAFYSASAPNPWRPYILLKHTTTLYIFSNTSALCPPPRYITTVYTCPNTSVLYQPIHSSPYITIL